MINLTEEAYEEHCESYDGYCTKCDQITRFGETEPDAQHYPCPECETNSVVGIEMALIQGDIEFSEDDS